jgi:flagellar protein FliT
MGVVQELHELTEKMHQKLFQKDMGQDQANLIEDIQQFLRDREELLKEMKAPYTDEERQLGQKILQMDKDIQEAFQQILDGLKHSMKQLQNQKKNNAKYVNPYKNVSTMDGMFFDKKN